MKLIKVFLVNLGGALGHKYACGLNLRESNYVADGRTVEHEHDHSVKAESHSAVGRNAVFFSIEKEAKTSLGNFFGKTESLEHFILNFGVADTD